MKICILGGAPSSCKLAPFGDPTWEIWACSPSNYIAPRVDAWFEVHSFDRKDVTGNEFYIQTLQRHDRVYITKPDPRMPKGIVLDYDEITKPYGGMFVQSFMQSSVSYMLAMAINLKPKAIGLWGVDMAAESEYDYQRPGCHFFFNEAMERDIEIIAPPESDILNPLPPYGYKEHWPMYWRQKARKIEILERKREAERLIMEKQNLLTAMEGALADINYINNTYLKP